MDPEQKTAIWIFLFLVLALFIIGIAIVAYSIYSAQQIHITVASPTPAPTNTPLVSATPIPSASATVFGLPTKTSGCSATNGLPDRACTPGAIFSSVTKDQICQSGYAKSVRDVTTDEKDTVYREYGITSHTTGQYEIDHLISLELGGSNDKANLWPEAASPTPGFHQKDSVENYLHDQVCSGVISLTAAQQAIATNWLAVYQTMPESSRRQ